MKIMDKPKIVVMCGSSRFTDIMAVCEWMIERDELAITMGLNLLPWWYDADLTDHLAEHENCADQMDELHLRKIDLADEIFVVDERLHAGGEPYIGESTTNEIAYAVKKGVCVRYFSEEQSIRTEVHKRITQSVEKQKKSPGHAIQGHDKELLLAHATRLKQTDGEGWAIGEMVERAVS